MTTHSKLIYCVLVITTIITGLLLCVISFAQSTQSSSASIKWVGGPYIGNLGSVAEIRVPNGYVFADANDTRILMEKMKNSVTGKELGLVAPSDYNWYVIFEFEDVGYISDDEKDKLNADELLKSIKADNEADNQERGKKGWPIMTVTGWEILPHYNVETHNLEWAIKGECEGQPFINYNTRLLGRGGVMRVTLVANPLILKNILPNYKQILSNHNFKPGQKYAEFRQGDKIATYGLSGLIAGGATAVAVKSGAFKWLWKVLVAAVVALLALFRGLFCKKDG